jgi:DUF2971 family protein
MAPLFLICFSAARDQASQWKAYGSVGHGLCLGIRILNEPGPDPSTVGVSLFRVDYSESSWRNKIQRGFEGVARELSQLTAAHGTLPRQAHRLALSALYRIAAHAAITAKKPAWSQELEWRQGAMVRREAALRPLERESGEKTVRYLPIHLRRDGRPLAFHEIIIGSNQDLVVAESRLRKVLSKAGYPNEHAELPRIETSSVIWP